MSPSSRYVAIVASPISSGIRRQYELPVEADGADRQSFVRWLLDVLPTNDQRSGGHRVELWTEAWP